MATKLMREELRPLYKAAKDAHPGLMLQRGLAEHDEENKKIKTEHIKCICKSPVGKFYRNAYGRWKQATSDAQRFRSVILKVETRLFIGLTGGGMLETGCAIGHSHGVPYIPGSSIKGVVRAHADEQFDTADGRAVCDELFGAPATENRPAGLSGLITFHDAWWVPDSAKHPLVQEVVTTHHPDYYGNDGRKPATDFDSPVPNAQIAVQGQFRFVLEGPVAWLPLAEDMLIAGLSARGAGAKTRTGYGLFAPEAVVPPKPRCEWVDETIADLAKTNRAQKDVTLRGRGLAKAWAAIEDQKLKRAALSDIRGRWDEQGWWENPPGRAARQAKAIYDEY